MSRLRITGGHARGRVLSREVGPGIRPTSARVREAWFSMVGHDLTGQTLLDAFAGSGIMAIEAWSRGATVTAVERDRRAFADLRARVAELDATMELVRADLRHALDGRGPFDLVFADPPYAEDPGPWLAVLAPITSGTLWFEADRQTRVPDEVAGLRLHRTRTFGSTALHAYAPEHP